MAEDTVNAPMSNANSSESEGATNSGDLSSDQQTDGNENKSMSGQGGSDAWLSLGLGVDASINAPAESGGDGDNTINFGLPPKSTIDKLILPVSGVVALVAIIIGFKGV